MLEKTDIQLKINNQAFIEATNLHNTFLKSRDYILDNIYNSIKDRFVKLYSTIHNSDESKFNASFKPDGAGLKFEVDFYNRGSHPPQALHSEGHQDSMGLCLYLALNEKLVSKDINLIILDDVVMSVDSGHRKQVCTILKKFYPNIQFVITTHDKTWATQLKNEGIVNRKGVIEFYDWSIDLGPLTNIVTDMWDKIEINIKKNEISIAAGTLRRGLEELFFNVCDSLQVEIKFKLDQKYELGDLMPPSVSKLREIIKKAKEAANSWSKKDDLEKISLFESQFKQILLRTNIEQWAINANVHYNKWANFSKEDFIPVVQAFQDLSSIFICNNCNGFLKIILDGYMLDSLRCNCNSINWNLKKSK